MYNIFEYNILLFYVLAQLIQILDGGVINNIIN